MTAPVRDLVAGLSVVGATTIARIGRAEAGWRLTDASGAVHGPFDAVAATFPAPQSAGLLDASGLALPGVARAAYAPCWSLMPAVEASPADILLEPKEGPIGLLALDSSKPGRPPGCRLTAHAAPDWSRAHLEEPRAMVEAALTRALGDRLGLATRPTSVRAHRWRSAQVEAALGKPCLYDPGLKLGAAGDWCLGPGIEAAHDSGLAPAGAILAGPGLSA